MRARTLALVAVIGASGVGCAIRRPVPSRGEPSCDHALYEVKPGETLYRISLRHGVQPGMLARANRIDDPTQLRVGQRLCIPATSSGDTEASPHRASLDSEVDRRDAAEALREALRTESREATPEEKAALPQGVRATAEHPTREGEPAGTRLEWPLRGVFYGRFGRRGGEVHDGIDLAAPAGTPVKTAAAGRVLFAGEQRGYGLLVIVEHGPGLVTLYAHNRDVRVREGQAVRDRQVVATVGESGKTSGPHLHFEVRVNGVPVDPLRFLGSPPST